MRKMRGGLSLWSHGESRELSCDQQMHRMRNLRKSLSYGCIGNCGKIESLDKAVFVKDRESFETAPFLNEKNPIMLRQMNTF